MTTRDPNDLRDARLDAAWRSASREEPPAALDDAIRAAARRDVAAGPRSTDARKAAVPESLRPERWWWPLAAAATIGAIAIGLLQLTEPDQIGAPGADKMTATDIPSAPVQSKKQDVAPRAEADAPKQEQAAEPALPAPAAPQPPSAARDRVAAAPPPARAPKAVRKDAAVPFPRDEGAAASTATKPSAPEERASANTATPAPPVAQPFPADALKRESKEATVQDAAPAAGLVAPTPAPVAESSASGFASGKRAAAPVWSAATEARRAEQAGVASVKASKGTPKALPTTRDKALAREPVAGAEDGTTGAAVDARAKTAPKLPVPEWIALIRRLRDEGRTDEAEKELAAFRTAYADHERILPPDLRDWKPAAR
jgi:hypothetical protein